MSCCMVGDVFPDACRFGDGFQITVDCLVARHGENGLLRLLSVISGIPRYQLLGRLQQRHRHTLRSLLAVVVEPMRAVYPQRDVLIRQHQNIHVSHARKRRKKHQSKGDGNKENQTERVVKQRFCGCLPLQPNSKERQDNARFPLPSHYLSCYQLKA